MFEEIVRFIRQIFNSKAFIPLHEPKFTGHEKEYIVDCIDSTFVSSVGEYVTKFENMIAEFTGTKYAVATVNGTAALHLALLLSGVRSGTEVLVQPYTFIATVNAITYCGAEPVFIDIDSQSLGLCPDKLANYLRKNSIHKKGKCFNKITGKEITACLPMHTFGHPVKIDQIVEVCAVYNVPVIEDAAESLGSFYKNKHTGTFANLGILSFNGNKIITTGGGGMILTDDEKIAQKAKHFSTQAKLPDPWEYNHDQIGYNYRMPNLNAALGVAQLKQLDSFINNKRKTAQLYSEFFENYPILFFAEPPYSKSNYWLNTILFSDKNERDSFLEYSNNNNVMTRPIWKMINELPMYANSYQDNLENAQRFANRIVNLPSSVIT